jgi:hypothetical protein
MRQFGNRMTKAQMIRRELRTAQMRSETMTAGRRKPSLPKLKFLERVETQAEEPPDE